MFIAEKSEIAHSRSCYSSVDRGACFVIRRSILQNPNLKKESEST